MSHSATALVLAGKRDGALDPLAAEAGVSHKCLTPVAGQPLIDHVVEALAASGFRRILVAIDDPEVLAAAPAVTNLRDRGLLAFTPARPGILDSVLVAAERAEFPLLVTTADNVLLTPQIVAELHDGLSRDTEAAAAFARRADVLAAHPEGQKRFYRFTDDAYSNCNLYWLASPRALDAGRIFQQGGQFAKHRSRMLTAFGLINLLVFALKLGTLGGLMSRLSRRFGVRLEAVVLDDGAAAIDVDNARTRLVAQQILTARGRTSERSVRSPPSLTAWG